MINVSYFNMVVTTLLSIYAFFLLKSIIPIYYLIIFLIIVLIILVVNYKLIHKYKKKRWMRLLLIFPTVIIIALEFYVLVQLDNLTTFLDFITNDHVEIDNFNLLTLKSNDEEMDSGDKIGIYVSKKETYTEAIKSLSRKYNQTLKMYYSYDDLFADLYSGEINYVYANEGEWQIVISSEEARYFDLKIIDEFVVETKIDVVPREFDITSESFIVYLSGIDSSGEILTNTPSDLNMLLVINPNTKEILTVSIPQNYFVLLPTYKAKDKLTNVGVYGINESMLAIENLLDTEIDYFLRVNFSGLVSLVDTLGGIDVYSEYSFKTDNYKFSTGINHLTGLEALEFSREIDSFSTEDRQRVKNMQAVVEAVVNKLSSSFVYLNSYDEILSSLEENISTNMPSENIIKLINMQLSELSSWQIESYSLNGSDSGQSTFLTNQIKEVILPSVDTIIIAKDKIKNAS